MGRKRALAGKISGCRIFFFAKTTSSVVKLSPVPSAKCQVPCQVQQQRLGEKECGGR